MDRDRRLTGFLRGQSDEVVAPLGFELNNPWRVSFVFQVRGCDEGGDRADGVQMEKRFF